MQQKIYPLTEHQVAQEAIDADALSVLRKLHEAGFVAYLVGGGVRDLLLGRTPKDFDISTSAKPEEIRRLFRNCLLIGKRFRLAHIRFGKKIIETSTFRSGDTESDRLIVRDNEWGTPEEDVKRRDFTINGLFYDPATETIIDFVDGYPDIQKRLLRTIGQPYLRFKQDPVRMLRLIKFEARFGLEVDPAVRVALLECRGEIIKSSQARVLEEILRMLESGASEPFFRLMAEYGLLQLLLPTLSSFFETPKGSEILLFLKEIDTRIQEDKEVVWDRAVLISCLLFPFLEKHLQIHFLDRNKTPHLGEIFSEASGIIDTIFEPFFLLPRRLKAIALSILVTQFRLTPYDPKKNSRKKIPHDPDFHLALHFLQIRACLEPGLEKVFKEWQSLFKDPEGPPAKPRRRKRRNGE